MYFWSCPGLSRGIAKLFLTCSSHFRKHQVVVEVAAVLWWILPGFSTIQQELVEVGTGTWNTGFCKMGLLGRPPARCYISFGACRIQANCVDKFYCFNMFSDILPIHMHSLTVPNYVSDVQLAETGWNARGSSIKLSRFTCKTSWKLLVFFSRPNMFFLVDPAYINHSLICDRYCLHLPWVEVITIYWLVVSGASCC